MAGEYLFALLLIQRQSYNVIDKKEMLANWQEFIGQTDIVMYLYT